MTALSQRKLSAWVCGACLATIWASSSKDGLEVGKLIPGLLFGTVMAVSMIRKEHPIPFPDHPGVFRNLVRDPDRVDRSQRARLENPRRFSRDRSVCLRPMVLLQIIRNRSDGSLGLILLKIPGSRSIPGQ